MIERSTATPAQYALWRAPVQRGVENTSSIVELKTPDDVAAVTQEGLALIKNVTVYGIGANAFNHKIPTLIQKAKGPKRGLRQPLGLTLPFNNPNIRGTFDLKRLGKNVALCKALEPDQLAKVLGALAFIRVPADIEATHRNKLPDYVTSEPKQDPYLGEVQYIQAWSPEGNDDAHVIIQAMLDRDQLPIMTSANISKEQKEIVTTQDAIQFARDKNLPIAIGRSDDGLPYLGSYGTLLARRDGFELVRAGFLRRKLWRDLLGDLLVADSAPEHSYPDNVLGDEHLPEAAKNATGEAKRNFILDELLRRAA